MNGKRKKLNSKKILMVDFFAIKPIFGRFFFLLEIDLKTESMLIVLEWLDKVPVLLEQCFFKQPR